tara:strand:- start:435 stop:1151 length:717 start_codon:yes stop_codon:yes gene_type:complete
MTRNLLVLFIVYTSFCYGQENNSKKKYWSGNFDLGLNFIKNTEETFQLNNIFDLNYKVKNHTLTINNNIAFINKTGQEKLLNKGKQDLKYELTSKNLNIRFLIQNLYDIDKKIKNRYTTGVGVSYSFFDKKTVNVGITIQREKENVLERDDKLQNRLNSNILFTKKIKDSIAVTLKNSYQPNLNSFGDFRWISNLSVRLNLSTQFLLSIYTNFNYDSEPETGIPESDYQLVNSISYSF